MEPFTVFIVVGLIFLILVSAFVSGTEVALIGSSISRIRRMKLQGDCRAIRVESLFEKKEDVVATLIILNTLVNVAASSASTMLFVAWFGNDGAILSTILIAFSVSLFAESLPKTYAIQHPEEVILKSSLLVNFAFYVLVPITKVFQFLVKISLYILRLEGDKEVISAADAMRNLIALHDSEGTMLRRDIDMLNSILDLAETSIDQVMVHRRDLFALSIDQKPGVLASEILNSRHSRIPVWSGEIDNIVGVVHVKDVINSIKNLHSGEIDDLNISEVMHKPIFIPDNTLLSAQLHAFRRDRAHMAFVVDEYGVLQGIVTLEDILEEIVGDIVDEHDLEPEPMFVKVAENTYNVLGKASIRDLNKRLRWNIPDEEASTVAGFLMHSAERIPEVGEVFVFYGFEFTVLKKFSNTIISIQVKVLDIDVERV